MYLKRLEVYGFKTFAQRTTFDFLPGVTAVVGPNGSGKSNVADAVRWVLGEQSFGNLRSKRTDDLIFSGGKGRAPMGFAEVFLTIDNSDRLLPLDFDEVTIGRRAYRNGESEYTINRARVRLRDVLDVVAPLGSSYTLINQGLVDAALALQPEDRRRLFEDAAEIGPYQAKKAESERRLRETEANLLRLNDLVSELEPQLRTLKRQARDAEAVHEVETELHALLEQHYAIHWARAEQQLAAATTREQELATRLAAARNAREQTEADLQAARDRLRYGRQALDQQRTILADAQRAQATAQRDLAVARERLAGIEQRATALDRRWAELEAAAATAQDDTSRLAQAASAARDQLHSARDQLQQAEAALAQEIEARRQAEQEVTARRDALLRATTALETAKARVAQIEQRGAALERELAEISAAQERAAAERDGRVTALGEAQKIVEAAEQQFAEAAQALESMQAERERLRQEREHADDHLAAARRTLGDLQTRYDALNRLARSYEGTFAGVRAAMQWSEREQRNFKLVSSLLHVPPELETAIEVALGTRLQQIVAERWADAEAAIAQLKRTNSGRATFLPLDTLKPAPRRSAPSMPGLRGVAADLIEVDDRYAPVAAYLLGRVLVADDLQAARRALSQLDGGWTIVTLAGEQVASGGALTGGAATKESGTLRRERELRTLPDQIAAARANVERVQATRDQIQQQSRDLQQAITQAEATLRQMRTSRDNVQRMIEARRRDLHRAEDALQALAQRQASVQQEQAALEDQRTALAQAVQSAEADQVAARSAVQHAQAVLHDRQAALQDGLEALQPLRDHQLRAEGELRSLEAEARAVDQTLRRLQTERADLDEQQRRLAHEQATLAQQVDQLGAAQAQAEAAARTARDHVDAAEHALRHEEAQLEALEASARKHTGALLDLEAEHAEAALAAQRCQSERDALWERAAEDNIELGNRHPEGTLGTGNREQGTGNREEMYGGASVPVEALDEAALSTRVEQLKNRLRRMGPVNALAPTEYKEAQERHAFLTAQLADIREAAAALRNAIAELETVMQQRFEETFDAIGHEFESAFKQLFGGGSAKLSLVRAEEGGAVQGVEIVAQPPGKRLLNLQLLSGGERSLTAAALLFAILKVNPSPFCMLDEVDAALDEANVVRFREALLDLAQRTQFVIITHNRGTVEAADTLYGITMGDDGGSRVVSLRLEEIDAEGSLALAT